MHLHILALFSGLALTMTDTHASDYSEGQVWSYHARLGESSSTLLINRVETDERFGKIFHISLSSLNIKNARSPEGFTTELPHLPVSEKSLDASVIELVGTSELNPNYREGYEEWRSQFEIGRAGVFDAGISEIVRIIEAGVSGE